MKKLMIFTLISLIFFTTGCTPRNLSYDSNNNFNKTTVNTSKLVGTKLSDVEKSFGVPYSATYYIDTNKISSKNLNSLTMQELNDSINSVTTFKSSTSDDSFLHVYTENGIVKKAVFGDYNLLSSKDFTKIVDKSSANYIVEYYKDRGYICENDFEMNYVAEEFMQKSISDFNRAFKLKSANFIASTIDNKEKLYFYPLVPHKVINDKDHKYPNYSNNEDAKLDTVNPVNNNISNTNKTDNKDLVNYANSSLVIYTKDDKIQSMSIEGKDFVYQIIDKAFSK